MIFKAVVSSKIYPEFGQVIITFLISSESTVTQLNCWRLWVLVAQ